MTIKGPALTISSTVPACLGVKCAVRDIKCSECVRIQGKYSEFVPLKEEACEDKRN